MAFFEWGVAIHDLDFEAIRSGEKSKEQVRRELKGMRGKAPPQIVKDYIAFPAARRRAIAGGRHAGDRPRPAHEPDASVAKRRMRPRDPRAARARPATSPARRSARR